MSVTLLPASCKKGEWQELVFDTVPVTAGAPGPAITSVAYELNFAKASLGMALWVDYAPDPMHLSNTLTVGALWSTQGGTFFFPSVDGPSVILTASGVVKICCPGTPDFKLTLNSTGTGTDHVTAWLCGTCGCCGGGGC